MLWTSRPGAARRILNNPEYVVAIITASLVGSTALAKNFKDQQIILVQPVPPKYKTLASNAVLEFEPFNQYRRLEELGLAITQELQKGQLRVVGRADPAQLRLRVRLSAYLPARTGVRNAQENRSIEVMAGNSRVCQDRLTPVSYEEGGGQLAGSVTVDEGAHKAVYTAAIGVTYSFSWIRSVNNRNVQPGDADPCSGFFGIARRAYQDIYSSSPALSTPEIEAELRKRFAKEVASVLVKTDREIALRLSAEEKLAPANLFLVTRRWDEAVNTVPPCERGVPRGDCLYTRALAREGAVYAGFLADPTPEQAREARAALMQAVADYEGALSADSRERVIAANAARVRTLLVEWEKFIDYTAWMRTATPPENLPDRNPVRVTAAPGASKDGTGGDRTFSTNEHRFRTAVRAELEQREQPPDEAFITAKAAEAAYFQPPIPGPDARQIALEEVKAWLAMREKWRIYREKVLIFMEDEKVTEATRQRLKFWEESLGIDPAVAGALREEAAKSAPARRTGVRKQ